MPTYTYRCQKCGEEFERFQSMSDEPVKRCPTCKGKVQRTFHPVGIVLKGSGFHRNDYRSASRKSGEKKDAGPTETKSDSKSESKTESKSEKKSDKASEGSKAESKSTSSD